MSESAAEKIVRLANMADYQSSLNKILSLAGNDMEVGEPDVPDDHSEAAEANDNEDMMHAGVHMNASGQACYGSVVLGHVLPHSSGKGYTGVHPTGMVTKKVPTRAKAAMALLHLHKYAPKDGKAKVKHVMLSNDVALDHVLALAGRTYSTATREKDASKGVALPDGSFPIPDKDALSDAIHAYGRAKDKDAAKAHIVSRAKALGATSMLPDGWA